MTSKTATLTRRPGRPRELTAREIEDIRKLLDAGQTVSAISRALRRPWSTVRAAIGRIEAAAESPVTLAGERGLVNPEGGHIRSDDTLPEAEGNGASEEESHV